MKRSLGLLVLLLVVFAQVSAAQQPDQKEKPAQAGVIEDARGVIEQSGIVGALSSLEAATAPQVKQAIEQLTLTLSLIALKVATDPELRDSVARAGSGMAALAETVVTEKSEEIVRALRAAADRIEQISTQRQADAAPK